MTQLGGARLEISIIAADGAQAAAVLAVHEILLAGYTGRDRDAVMRHIRELEAIGVAPPPHAPMVYPVPADLLTTAAAIDVQAAETSGEAEFCLIQHAGALLVGLGSDHTDRKHEAIDITASKSLCPKVVGRTFWRFADVEGHWDEMEIRSWTWQGESRRLYQQGSLAEFMTVDRLLDEVRGAGHPNLTDRLVFGGTLPTIGGLAFGSRFEAELRDPVLGRTLTLAYDVHNVGVLRR